MGEPASVLSKAKDLAGEASPAPAKHALSEANGNPSATFLFEGGLNERLQLRAFEHQRMSATGNC